MSESDCPINDQEWDSSANEAFRRWRLVLFLPFPRTRSRSVPDVMNDHLVVPDLIHDQIFANQKSSKARLACRSPDMRRDRNARSRMFNSSNETACGLPIVRSYVRKNLIEIGKCATFISELHALR
jgi:hypothetical protein